MFKFKQSRSLLELAKENTKRYPAIRLAKAIMKTDLDIKTGSEKGHCRCWIAKSINNKEYLKDLANHYEKQGFTIDDEQDCLYIRWT